MACKKRPHRPLTLVRVGQVLFANSPPIRSEDGASFPPIPSIRAKTRLSLPKPLLSSASIGRWRSGKQKTNCRAANANASSVSG